MGGKVALYLATIGMNVHLAVKNTNHVFEVIILSFCQSQCKILKILSSLFRIDRCDLCPIHKTYRYIRI